MHDLHSRPGFRRSSLLLAGTAVMGILVSAVSLASVGPVASPNETGHDAARTPRFFTVTPTVSVSPPVVVRPHASASSLLSVVNQQDIRADQRLIADNVLRALPAWCRDNLKSFYVNYNKNAANRGLGGADTIIVIGTVPENEFRALITHECGHVTDIGGLRGTPAAGRSGFVDGNTPVFRNDPSIAFYQISWVSTKAYRPGTKDRDFVSGYAESDPFEDFAETFAFYALQKQEFQRLAQSNPVLKAKYDYMDLYIFHGTPEMASGQFKSGSRVPWDVTKLPYIWHAKR